MSDSDDLALRTDMPHDFSMAEELSSLTQAGLVKPWESLAPGQHTIIGVYLVIVGKISY